MDLNEDGHNDILSGCYSRHSTPMAGLFQVLWGRADGIFKKASPLKGIDGEPLIIPLKDDADITENICTRPTAVDWDSDGDLDLVVGNFAGSFYLFMGEGQGKFQSKPTAVETGGRPLKISGAHSDPFAVDWDQDGDLDLLSGSSNGGVFWSENKAGKGELPELLPFQTLIEAGQSIQVGKPPSENALVGPTRATRVWVDDVDGDGKLDILVGDSVTLVSPAPGFSEAEMTARLAQWEIDLSKALQQLEANDSDEELRNKAGQRYLELRHERSKFMREDATGYIWLYRQR